MNNQRSTYNLSTQNKINGVIFTLLFLQITLFGNAQQSVDLLSSKLDSLAKRQASELNYIQTNKDIYETGEDLWFKVYILDAQFLTPSLLSKTLYLQLLNEKNKQAVWEEKYEIKNGFSNGHVFINETLPEGNYLLAAYTSNSFLKNQKELKAVKCIRIKKDLKPKPSLDVQFSNYSFNTGDSIGVTIKALTEQQKPLYAKIQVELLKNGKSLEEIESVTNTDGKAKITFNPKYTSPELKLQVKATHTNATENITLPVPFDLDYPLQFSLFPEGGQLVTGIKARVAFNAVNINGLPETVSGILFENNDSLLTFNSTHNGMGCFDFIPDKNKQYHIKLTQPAIDSIFQLPTIQNKGITMQLAKHDSSYLYFKVQQTEGMPNDKIYIRGQLRGVAYCIASGELDDELTIKIPLNHFPLQGIAEFTLFNSKFLPLAERLVYVNTENRINIEAKISKKKYSTREKVILNLKVTDSTGKPIIANLGVTVFDKIYQNNQNTNTILSHYHLFTQLKGNIYNPTFYFNKKNKNRMEALDLLMLTFGWRKYVWNERVLNKLEADKTQLIQDGIHGKMFATLKKKKAAIENELIMTNYSDGNKTKYLTPDIHDRFEITSDELKIWEGGYIYLQPVNYEYFGYKLIIENPFDSISINMGSMQVFYPEVKINRKIEFRSNILRSNVIDIDEIVVKGKQEAQFRDKFIRQLDSIAKENYRANFVIIYDGNRISTEKPEEGKIYKVHYKGRNRLSDLVFHFPVYTADELLEQFNISSIKANYKNKEFYQTKYDKKDESFMIPDYRNTLLWAPSVFTDEKGEAELEFYCSDIYTDFIGIVEGLSAIGDLGYEEFEFRVLKTNPFTWEK